MSLKIFLSNIYGRESITSKWRFCDGFIHFQVECIQTSHFQRFVCAYVNVCQQHNSKTNYSISLKYNVKHLCYKLILHETFNNIRQKLSIQRCIKKILIQYDLWTKHLVNSFQYIQTALKIMKFTCIFAKLKNTQPKDYGMK